VAPVDNFDALVAAVDFGEVVDQDPAQRMIRVRQADMRQPPRSELADQRRSIDRQSDDDFSFRHPAPPPVERPPIREPRKLSERIAPSDFESTFRRMRDDRPKLPSPSDPDYYQKLCDLMVDEQSWHLRDEAIDKLLSVDPQDIEDKAVRQQIARNFRELAMDDGHSRTAEKAIRGLVRYGGKHSVPLLIEIMDRERLRVPSEVFDGLAQLKDPRGAEALTRQLGNFFNHQAAANALRKMGPVAESALIVVAPSDDPDISLAAVQLLGDVGTSKSMRLLRQASRSRNPQIVDAAGIAMRKIRERGKSRD
jgi:hypothetical protein